MKGWNYLIYEKEAGFIARASGTHHHNNFISHICDIYLDDIILISLEYETIEIKEECLETEAGCVRTCRITVEARKRSKTHTWK